LTAFPFKVRRLFLPCFGGVLRDELQIDGKAFQKTVSNLAPASRWWGDALRLSGHHLTMPGQPERGSREENQHR